MTFVKGINTALRLFNRLPKPIKGLLVDAAALKLILGAFGGDKILGGVTSLVGQYIILNRLFKNFNAAPNVKPSLSKKIWNSRIAGFIRALAPAVIIATVVLTYDYGKAKKVYDKARKQGKDVGLAAGQAYVNGFKSVPVLGNLLKPFIERFNKNINQNKGKFSGAEGSIGYRIGSGILSGIGQGLTPSMGSW